ncbi:hypothetical protein Acsp01_77320 [Actinoplanes sp. NBRC 101535]|nr:hypothetical protein Acsp01_77320 [Actinoplanes sp. NBRC 101535]
MGLTVLATVSAGLLATPAEAAAKGVVSTMWGTRVVYKAAKGVQNKVVLSTKGLTTIVDDVVAIKAGKGCKAVKGDKTKVTCKLKHKPTTVLVYTYDRKDRITNKTGSDMHAEGGSGPDTIIGGPLGDGLYGGSGDDILYGRGGGDGLNGEAGQDTLYGEAGDDFLSGDSGTGKLYADVLSGGTGSDTASYSGYTKPITVDLDGAGRDDGAAGEHDTVRTDVENIFGGRGADRLTGNAAANDINGYFGDDVIRGGEGDDKLTGGDGVDQIYGEAGDDFLNGWSAPSALDLLDGGPNGSAGDWCYGEDTDRRTDCER